MIMSLPRPPSCTVKFAEAGASEKFEALNVAVTDLAAFTVSVHASVPAQAPVQPEKAEPAAAVAVSVNIVPPAKLAEHVAPQLIPGGVLVTVPLPVPISATDTSKPTTPKMNTVPQPSCRQEKSPPKSAVP